MNVQPQQVVAFVGGGGKTISILRLARELSSRRQRVIVTTTTRMGPWQVAGGLVLSIGPSTSALSPITCEQIQSQLERNKVVVIIGEETPEKLIGVDPGVIRQLASLNSVVLVEADGARTRSFKAPAPYEPVWPPNTSLAVALVGIDAVGVPLVDEYIHRPERVSALTGLLVGDLVTPETIAACVAHPEGLFARVPAQARHALLINKVKTPSQLEAARRIAGCLASQNEAFQVIIADVSMEAVTIWP